MKFNKKHLLVLFVSFGSYSIFAQEESVLSDLITDRPDQTESPTTISKGFLQIETGSYYESFKENNIKYEAYTYNTTLLRFGLLNNLELRMETEFVEGRIKVDGHTLDNVTSGLQPLKFGFKTTIAPENGWMPEIGFLGQLYLPFAASTDYKTETTGVEFRFAFEHTLSEKSSIGYNIGADWLDDSAEASYIYTLSYGLDLTERLGIFAEVYGNLPENSKSYHYWDAGLTYIISPNVQLDASVGTSITKGQDLLISAGLSFRIPKKQ